MKRILFAPDQPAVSAPPAAPAASTPPPSPTPAPTPSSGTEDAGFAEIEGAFKKFDTAVSPPPKPSGGDGKPSAAAPAQSPKPADHTPAAPVKTPKELRAELERVQGELASKSKQQSDLEAKIAQYEKQGFDTKALLARLEAKDKEFSALQGELRALKQEDSPEFVKQYIAPFNDAATEASEYIEKLTKTDGTPANYKQDFAPIYWLLKNSTGAKARERAIELFGEEEAPDVIEHAKTLVRLDKSAIKAREQERALTAQQLEERKGQQIQIQSKNKEAWERVTDDLTKSVPDYRDPPEDKEAAELRAKAFAYIDKPFDDTPQTRVRLAHMRHMAAAFWPHKLQIQRLTAKLAERDKTIAGLKPKPPSGGNERPGGESAPSAGDLTQDQWAEQARKAVEGAA